MRSTVLDFTGKKARTRVYCTRPPDVIHVIGVSRPSLFFFLPLFRFYAQTAEQKKIWRPERLAFTWSILVTVHIIVTANCIPSVSVLLCGFL